MARTDVTPITPLGSYPARPLVANSADVAFVAAGADFALGHQVDITGGEMLLVYNGNVGAQTVTITSIEDKDHRIGHITAYSVGIAEYALFGPFELDGWRQADGHLYFEASAADVEFMVIQTR